MNSVYKVAYLAGVMIFQVTIYEIRGFRRVGAQVTSMIVLSVLMTQLMLSESSLARSLVLTDIAVVDGRLSQRRWKRRRRERMQRFDVLLQVITLRAFIIAVPTEDVSYSSTIWAKEPLFFLFQIRSFISLFL